MNFPSNAQANSVPPARQVVRVIHCDFEQEILLRAEIYSLTDLVLRYSLIFRIVAAGQAWPHSSRGNNRAASSPAADFSTPILSRDDAPRHGR